MLGGLAALGRTIDRAWRPGDPGLRLSVELCATYWHFLLLVWLVLFALLAGWADDFLALCRSLTSRGADIEGIGGWPVPPLAIPARKIGRASWWGRVCQYVV